MATTYRSSEHREHLLRLISEASEDTLIYDELQPYATLTWDSANLSPSNLRWLLTHREQLGTNTTTLVRKQREQHANIELLPVFIEELTAKELLESNVIGWLRADGGRRMWSALWERWNTEPVLQEKLLGIEIALAARQEFGHLFNGLEAEELLEKMRDGLRSRVGIPMWIGSTEDAVVPKTAKLLADAVRDSWLETGSFTAAAMHIHMIVTAFVDEETEAALSHELANNWNNWQTNSRIDWALNLLRNSKQVTEENSWKLAGHILKKRLGASGSLSNPYMGMALITPHPRKQGSTGRRWLPSLKAIATMEPIIGSEAADVLRIGIGEKPTTDLPEKWTADAAVLDYWIASPQVTNETLLKYLPDPIPAARLARLVRTRDWDVPYSIEEMDVAGAAKHFPVGAQSGQVVHLWLTTPVGKVGNLWGSVQDRLYAHAKAAAEHGQLRKAVEAATISQLVAYSDNPEIREMTQLVMRETLGNDVGAWRLLATLEGTEQDGTLTLENVASIASEPNRNVNSGGKS